MTPRIGTSSILGSLKNVATQAWRYRYVLDCTAEMGDPKEVECFWVESAPVLYLTMNGMVQEPNLQGRKKRAMTSRTGRPVSSAFEPFITDNCPCKSVLAHHLFYCTPS
jgi:hypothetical protein